VAFVRRITLPENFIMRPDERAAVAPDHARGLVYAGSRDGTLLALDVQSAEVRWEYELGGPAAGVPKVVENGGVLLVGTDNGALTALDLETVSPRWTYETQGTIREEPLVVEGVVYFANSRGQVFALDMRTGAWRWQYEGEFQPGFTIHGRAGLAFMAAVDADIGRAGSLYAGFDDGRVVALEAGSGEPLWTASVAPPGGGEFVDCDSTPLVDAERGEIVVAGQATGVHGLAISDGTARWTFRARAAGTVVEGPAGSLLFASPLQGFFSIERGGSMRWHQPLDPGVVSAPVVVDDVAFLAHSVRGLLAFDARDGTHLATLDVGSGMSSVPTYDPEGGRFYVTTNRGLLLALRVARPG
jgi:outer membrane protein assembly factor BamB